MRCVAFKALARGSLVGVADLMMDSGLVLLGCTFHTANDKAWVNPPGRPQLDADRKPIVENGKIVYAPVVEFSEKRVRFAWSAQAVAAIEAFRAAESKAPANAGAMNGGTRSEVANRGARHG